ncbi:MAG: RtcB family protein [Patescibacteria group bacterium]|nr:RtcB family protein [Patescibacteria group bacterium]
MPVKKVLSYTGTGEKPGKPVKIWTDEIEASAQQQLEQLSTLPFIYKHVAVMPDVHAGIGSTVGSVIATRKAIVPAAVGVDIGCGMMAHRLNIMASDLPDNLGPLRSQIEFQIPHGRSDNGGENDTGAWRDGTPLQVMEEWGKLHDADKRLGMLYEKHPKLFRGLSYARQGSRQLGTLGTGNHFVELCVDLNQHVWLMLHSGSRGIGNRIGSYFIEKAKEEMERYFIKPPSTDLAYLPEGTPLFADYWHAVSWAQDYARVNRELMMLGALGAVAVTLKRPITVDTFAVNCHHNYVAIENHFRENVYVTRKGAVRARKGDLGIIPGSMGARSFIVRGKGNPESFCSCSHGAGRKMSRTEAERRFTVDDVVAQTAGVECRKDAGVVDEIPGAYKDIGQVMENQSDLVEVVAELKQVLCVKG